MQATRIQHPQMEKLPPIRVTIVSSANDVTIRISDQGSPQRLPLSRSTHLGTEGGGLLKSHNTISSPPDLFSFSHIRNANRLEDSTVGALRSRSVQGMKATVAEQVDRWNQGPVDKDARVSASPNSRIGIGLPMSNIYATYFGGSLDLVSVDGWGEST